MHTESGFFLNAQVYSVSHIDGERTRGESLDKEIRIGHGGGGVSILVACPICTNLQRRTRRNPSSEADDEWVHRRQTLRKWFLSEYSGVFSLEH